MKFKFIFFISLVLAPKDPRRGPPEIAPSKPVLSRWGNMHEFYIIMDVPYKDQFIDWYFPKVLLCGFFIFISLV
jgi:hypothetical protein